MYNILSIIFLIAGFVVDNADQSISLFFISAIFGIAGAISAVALNLKSKDVKQEIEQLQK